MLQQTRVDVAIPYYERFLERFPDVVALARSPLAGVLDAWAGLGYYGRARNLHAAAQRLVSEHGGAFPRGLVGLQALPGVGRYTAGAIRSIAFGEPAPILDGNCVRVFARLFGVDADVDAGHVRRRMWAWAEQWATGRDPGTANQALMELGALVCTKPIPRCDDCPLAADCVARCTGRERRLPRPRSRAAPQRLELEAVLASRRGRLLLVRRASGRLLRDWWELPACRAEAKAAATTHGIARRLHERLGVELGALQPLAQVRHGISSHRLDVRLFAGHARSARTLARAAHHSTHTRSLASLDHGAIEARWADADQCRALPLSTLARKALRAAAIHDPRWSRFLPRRSLDHASA